MEKYSKSDNYILFQGNMLDMLQEIKENSIDSIVTDPPYELNFMNKGWDNSGIAFQEETWEKCYEVLKPGGYLLAFGGSRTYYRIACAIEDAGFEIRDCIMWLYGSGFPKSMDISKQIDKRNGRKNEDFKNLGNYLMTSRKNKNLTTIKLAELGKFYSNINHGGGVSNWELGYNVPTKSQYKILKEILDLDDRFDWLIERVEAEREIIGKKDYTMPSKIYDINNGSGERLVQNITKPSTDLAKQWQGWGTCLKPAYEPIIVARKPFKGSLVDNVIENGVGGINIDECRVGTDERTYKGMSSKQPENAGCFRDDNWQPKDIKVTVNGRFPANVIHDGLQEEWSRYFYCAKASKKDRDEGLDEFEEKQITDGNIRSNSETARKFGANSALRKNIHPTVKPTELMQYLVRLVTPKNGIVLDPFMGSGSTGKAVMCENKERNANYKFIGIELTEEYLPIAEARINYASKQAIERNKERQLDIFEME